MAFRVWCYLLALPLMAGCVCVPSRHEVAMPPANAIPQEVVAVWLEAMTAKDSETALALMVPGEDHSMEFEHSQGPFKNWIDISGLEVGEPYEGIDCEPGEQCVRVPVSFKLCAHEFTGDGDPWTHPFTLQNEGGRWLVKGYGSG